MYINDTLINNLVNSFCVCFISADLIYIQLFPHYTYMFTEFHKFFWILNINSSYIHFTVRNWFILYIHIY